MAAIFRRGGSSEREAEQKPGQPGPEMLRTGALLSPWFIEYRLHEEVDRAHRYERPLAIMIASPALLPGEHLSRDAHRAASEAALSAARTTDLVGWWSAGDGRILIIMPETTPEDASVAATRWRDQMWRYGRAVNGPKWDIVLLHDLDEFKSRELIDEITQTRIEAEQSGNTPSIQNVA